MKLQSNRQLSRLLIAIASVSALSSPAFAANDSWAGSAGSTDWNQATWAGGNTTPVSGDALTFGPTNNSTSTTLTNTLTNSSFNIAGISFIANAKAYTMTGNTFNLTAGISNNSSVNEIFSETGGLTNSVSSTFTVGATNGISITTGLTDVSTGALTTTVTGTGGTLTLGSFTLNSGATAAVTDTLTGSGNLTITGAVTNGSAFANGINYTGSGTLTLGGANTYSGATTITSGTVVLSGTNSSTTGTTSLNGGALDINSNGALAGGLFNFGGNATLDNTSSTAVTGQPNNPNFTMGSVTVTYGGTRNLNMGNGSLTVTGNPVFTLNGTGSLVFGGSLINGADSVRTLAVNKGTSATSSISFGGYQLTGTGSTAARIDIINGSGNVNITGPVTDGVSAGSSLNYAGSGTLTLSGASTNTGSTIVSSGTLAIGASSTPTSGTVTSGPLGDGYLVLNTGTVIAVNGAQTVGNNIAVNADAAGTIGGSNALTFNGKLSLAGTGAPMSGQHWTTIVVNNTATTTLAGGIDLHGQKMFFDGSGNLVISGAVVDSAPTAPNFSYQGTGSMTLSGANSYTTGTQDYQGTVVVGTNAPNGGTSVTGAFGNATSAVVLGNSSGTHGSGSAGTAGAAIVTNGAFTVGRAVTETASWVNSSLAIGGVQSTGTSTYTGTITLASNSASAGSTTLTSATGGEVDFNDVIQNGTGTQSVAIGGGGLVKLLGANTFGGTGNSVTITGGSTLNLGTATNTGSLGNGGNTLIFNNGIFQYSAATPFDLTATRSVSLASGGGTIDTNGNSVTFNNAISGAGGLTLSDTPGTGTLTLAAANTYAGGITVNKGTLATTGFGTLGNTSGALAVNTGGNLNLSGTSQTVGNLSGTGGTIYNNTSGLSTLTVGNGTAATSTGTYSGVIKDNTGTGGQVALTKTGSGSITLNGANTYTGATSVNGGTLAIGPLGSLGGTAVSLSGTGNLQVGTLNSSASTTLGSGSTGSLTITNGGSLIFANGVAGASSTAVDNLILGNTAAGTAVLVLNNTGVGSNPAINIGVGGSGGSDEIVFSGASGLLANLTGATTINLNVLTALNGTTQQLIAWGALPTGSGSFQLGTTNGLGTNGYTLGLVETSAGLFLTESAVSNAYWQGSLGSNWATGLPGGPSNFTTDQAGTTNRTAALDSFTTVTFAATGASAASYANTTLGGSPTINSLVLNVAGVGIDTGTPGTNTLTLAAAGQAITVAASLGTENIASNIAMTNSETWMINGGSTLVASGSVSGTGSTLTKAGTGTLVLSGSNSYSGATAITGGALSVQSADALDGTTGVSVTSGATLQLAGSGFTTTNAIALTLNGTGISNSGALDNVSGNNTYTGNITLGSDSTIRAEAGSTLTLSGSTITNAANSTLTLTGGGTGDLVGTLSSGALVKNGSGLWSLEANNSYAGGTTVNAGTLQLGTNSNSFGNPTFLGSATGALTVNTGGTLDLFGWGVSVGNLNGTGGTITNSFTAFPLQSVLTLNTSAASSYAGSITDGAGGVAVIKQGTATQTFSGNNSYTGTTQVTAGALNIASNGALGSATASTSNVIVSSGAALQLSGGITTTAAVPLTLTGTGVTGAANGALENVSGSNTFTGPVTLSGDSSIGSDTGSTLNLASTATINGSGNLTLIGGGNGNLAGSIGSGISSLTLTSSGTYTSTTNTTGTWTLSGANSYSGATTINNGTLAYTSAAALASGSTINMGTTTANTFADLNYTGSGDTVANTLNITGTTAVLGNTGTGTITYSGTPTVATGTHTLVLGNPTDTVGGIIGNLSNGSGTLNVTKTGTVNDRWILNGTNSYTGTTTINGGVLQVAAGTTFSNLQMAGTVSNAILQTSGTLNLTSTGTGTNFNWGASSGFAARNGNLTVTLNNGATLNWGSGGFSGNGGAVVDFGSATANGQVTLTNNINLNTTDGFQQSIYVAQGQGGDSAVLTGVISGGTTVPSVGPPAVQGSASGLTKSGAGILILTNGNSSYTGYTSIESGTLVAEASSTITATPTAGAAGYTATGVFGNGYGFYGAATATAGYSTINVGFNQGGGSNVGGVTNPTLLIGSQTVGGSNSIANPVAIDWNNGSGQVFGIGGYSDANATFSGLVTLSGSNATSGNTFAVTQVATTGTDALNITGGITGTTGAINFANVGKVNVTTTGITGAVAVNQTGAGTTTFAAANTYTGGSTVTGGNFQLIGSTSATGAFNVGGVTGGLSTATLSGTGTVGGALTTSSANSNVAHLAPGVNTAGSNTGGAGTLTIAGNLNIGTGTNIDIDLSSSTSTGDDLIAMSGGTLTLGSSLTFNFNQLSGANTLNTTSPYTLISGFTGTPTLPTSFTSTGINGYTAVYSIVGNALDVTFTNASLPPNSAFYTGATSTDLNTASNFNTTASGSTATTVAIGSNTDVYLTANSASNTAPTLNSANTTVNSVTFTGSGTSATAGVTLSGSKTLTIGGGTGTNTPGIVVQAGSGANTISAPVALGVGQTWSNASSNLLTVSGGITGTGNLALQANSTGGITLSGGSVNHTGSITNSGTGSGTTTISSVIGSNVTTVTQNSATSTLVLSAANNYAGGTSVTAGKLFVNNTTGSATGSGAVSVTGSTSVLKGTGIIGGAVTLSSGANLYSGSTAGGTGVGSGMNLTSSLAVNGASLTFQLNNGTNTATYANPNMTTSFLNLGSTGTISFTGTDSINLVDLTSGGLTLRTNAPYLLISAASDSMFSGLVTINAAGQLGLDQNGTVLGVWQGGALSNYTALTINELSADGVTSLAHATTADPGYYQPSLYLINGDLEVVPEPGTWALMLGGLALLVFIQRRRSKLS